MIAPKFLLKLILLVLLAGCSATSGPESERSSTPELLPRPLRDAGLAIHNTVMAAGLYGNGAAGRKGAALATDARPAGRSPSVTWLGHSSSIIRIAGVTVLTDPVIVPKSSPASPLPPRLGPPPLTVDELPVIDVIVLSHGDYDHLHLPTIKALAQRFPQAMVLAPRGVAAPLVAGGFPQATELSEGESATLGRLRMTALPARHETRRNPFSLKDGGAVSWELADGRTRILFIGDSAYGPAFARIGAARGPYNAVLVPIGAYEPRSLVANVHATPEEAAQIARDVRAKLAIGIHWGTFALSPDRPEEARRRFLAARGGGVATRVLDLGETLVVR